MFVVFVAYGRPGSSESHLLYSNSFLFFNLLFFSIFFFSSLFSFHCVVVMDAPKALSSVAPGLYIDRSRNFVVEYIYEYGRYLDAHRFGAMHMRSYSPLMYGCRLKMYCDTVVRTWIKW